jgi:hypothetical protein
MNREGTQRGDKDDDVTDEQKHGLLHSGKRVRTMHEFRQAHCENLKLGYEKATPSGASRHPIGEEGHFLSFVICVASKHLLALHDLLPA